MIVTLAYTPADAHITNITTASADSLNNPSNEIDIPSKQNSEHCHKAAGLACGSSAFTMSMGYQDIILGTFNVTLVSSAKNKPLFPSPIPPYRPPMRIAL